MGNPPEGKPKPEQGWQPPPNPPNDRDAAALLTPPPSSRDSGAGFDAPTVVDIPRSSVSPADAPTILDVGAPRQPSPPGSGSHQPMLPPGTVLGQRYEIVAMLGEGGMGAVYKAIDRELNRPVALKVIRPELARNKAIIDRFKQELLLAREVTHRNVIRIYDLGEADRVKFITMEYVEGEDLRALLLRKKKLAPEEAVDIIQQVCRALDAAHSVGIIHRDLKPQNIMQDKTGRILVMDFGLARTLEGDGMTQSGALVGTMDYMSPEQALAKPLDQRSDLYTVGLIFYELLTGAMPFAADSALASLIKRTQEQVAPVSDHDNTIPRSVVNIVSKCLERDVNLRYQSATELLADLEAWQGKRAAATLSFNAKVGPWGQTLPWPLIAAVVTVVLLAALAWVWREKLLAPLAKPGRAVPQVSLAILPFRNASGDPAMDWLGSSLAEMLSTDVGQSARLRTVPQDRVHQVFSDLHLAPNVSVDPETLKRVAEFSNADTLVSGQYAKFGGQIRIDATVQDLKHDRSVPLKIDGVDEKDIPGAVDRLAGLIRSNLSFSPDVIKELKASSFQPTSQSIPALRDYNQGVELLREGKNLEAVKALQSAINEDSQFALAYSRLADAQSALGYDSDAEQASRKAVELSQQLPLAEKYLIEATHARIVKDNDKAIQAYENLSKSQPDNGDVLYALGSLYREHGDYEKARAVFTKILQTDPKNIRALWQQGALEIMNGNAQAALDPLNKGLSLAIQVDNQEQKALILLAVGVAYRLLNKPADALRNYQESLAINEKIGQKRAMASDLNEMAQVQAMTGKSDAAIASLNRALQIRQEIGAKKEAGDSLIDLGNLYLDRGQYDQALKMYKESLDIQRDAGDQNYQALCLNNIGNLYLSHGDNEDALTYLQQALELRQKLNVPSAIAETLHNLGVAYANLGQDENAMSDFMRALDLYRKAGDQRGAASESHGMAFLFEFQARYGAAVNAMQDALKPLRDAGDRSPEMAQTLVDYGEALTEAGRGAEASKILDEAQGLVRDLKSESLRAALLNAKGNVLFYAGDVKGAKPLYEQAALAALHGKSGDDLIAKANVAKATLAEGRSAAMIAEFGRLAQQAEALGQRQLAVECAVYQAQAMVNDKDLSRARPLLEQSLGKSEKLGLRLQTAKIHYLLGTSARLSGNATDAADQYGQSLRLLDDIKKDPGADHVLERSDLHSIYDDATHWLNAAKG